MSESHPNAGGAVESDIRIEPTPDGATKVWLAVGNEEVSRTYIVPLVIRIGAATVRMDGIGGVWTGEQHRQRGYSRRVLGAALDRMRAGDAHLSTLYGILDFYPKFGYATIGPEHLIRLLDLDRNRDRDLPAGWRVRPFAVEDLPAARRLYDLATTGAVGAAVRNERGWAALERSAAATDECRVVEDDSGRLVAYIWRLADTWWVRRLQREGHPTLTIGEVMVEGPAAADAALAACKTWAVERGEESVAIVAPPEGPLAMAAMLRRSRIEKHYSRDADFMGRVLDVRRLLTAMLPEFEIRLRAAGIDFADPLRIQTEEGGATLQVDPDGLHVQSEPLGHGEPETLLVTMPQSALARLVFGTFSPEELLARLPVPPEDRAAELLAALFPARNPHLYPIDRF